MMNCANCRYCMGEFDFDFLDWDYHCDIDGKYKIDIKKENNCEFMDSKTDSLTNKGKLKLIGRNL